MDLLSSQLSAQILRRGWTHSSRQVFQHQLKWSNHMSVNSSAAEHNSPVIKAGVHFFYGLSIWGKDVKDCQNSDMLFSWTLIKLISRKSSTYTRLHPCLYTSQSCGLLPLLCRLWQAGGWWSTGGHLNTKISFTHFLIHSAVKHVLSLSFSLSGVQWW